MGDSHFGGDHEKKNEVVGGAIFQGRNREKIRIFSTEYDERK